MFGRNDGILLGNELVSKIQKSYLCDKFQDDWLTSHSCYRVGKKMHFFQKYLFTRKQIKIIT